MDSWHHRCHGCSSGACLYLLRLFLELGAPGGTAGGLKITTFLVLLLLLEGNSGLCHILIWGGEHWLSSWCRRLWCNSDFQPLFLLGLLALGLVTDSGHQDYYLMIAIGTGYSWCDVYHYQPQPQLVWLWLCCCLWTGGAADSYGPVQPLSTEGVYAY